jgi:integrase/recombinase XerD
MRTDVKEFIESLRLQPRTVETYKKLLEKFFSQVGADRPLDDVGIGVINGFFKRLSDDGRKSQTVASYSIVLRKFLNFHSRVDLAERIETPRVRHKKRVHISHLNWVEFLEAAGKDKYDGPRAQALCATILGTGMRLSEALSMKVGDVDWEKARIKVTLKGGEDAFYSMVLLDDMREHLLTYIADRRSGYVFQGQSNGHLSPRTAEEIVKRAAVRAKVPSAKLVSPHALRHSLAHWMIWEQKWPTLVVKNLLHHKRVETTGIYTDGMQDEMDDFIARNRP